MGSGRLPTGLPVNRRKNSAWRWFTGNNWICDSQICKSRDFGILGQLPAIHFSIWSKSPKAAVGAYQSRVPMSDARELWFGTLLTQGSVIAFRNSRFLPVSMLKTARKAHLNAVKGPPLLDNSAQREEPTTSKLRIKEARCSWPGGFPAKNALMQTPRRIINRCELIINHQPVGTQ